MRYHDTKRVMHVALRTHLIADFYIFTGADAYLDFSVIENTSYYPNSPSSFQWPGVPPFADTEGGIYLLDAGDHLAVAVAEFVGRDGSHNRVYRIHAADLPNDASYWPTEAICAASIPVWAQRMFLVLKYGEEGVLYDAPIPDNELAEHWMWGRRRYGTKNNPINRLLNLLGIDPDGRSRIAQVYPPDYIVKAMQEVDRQVGILCGVGSGEIAKEDLVEFPGSF